ncbi:MAG: phosphoglucosamine mutase [Acidimicrobiales bacterium]
MTLRFGTDGVRGIANLDLTPELVVALGRAAARVLSADRFLIGRDTRRSGPMLEAALAVGLASEGATVASLGVVPTPAVAHACAQQASAGAMVSASHNPFTDNGIKLFSAGGRKLSDELEARLEAALDHLVHGAGPGDRALTGTDVGTLTAAPEHVLTYADAVIASIEGRDLGGMRLVVDCANGSASAIAPDVLRRLGAEVVVLHADPDGRNINDSCGSTHPEDLKRAVTDHRAQAGLAFDGDADRVLAVDAAGALVDGDQVIGICAIDLHDRGLLRGDAIAVTVMSNLGLRRAMEAQGIGIVETAVGDRSVLDALDAGGLSLGGEQSGHVIFRDLATTGDGLLTGVQLLDAVCRSSRSLSELAAVVVRLPQVLRNVRVAATGFDPSSLIAAELAAAATDLGDDGRVLVRASGTEPLVRVMVEAATQSRADAVADRLAAAVQAAASPRSDRR